MPYALTIADMPWLNKKCFKILMLLITQIISCNMPLPDNKDKTPKEIELAYTPGPIYKVC